MAEQYRACSYDKLDIVPYLNPERDIEGIMEIVVDKTIVSGLTSRNSITNAATLKLREFFGGNFDELDLIMFCIPPGTIRMDGAQEWLSFALTNNKITYYNDQNGWCRSNSIKMHEVGHNMNLGHSGEAFTVDDLTGMMGLSYREFDREGGFQRMCYNAVKNYQVGWYANQQMDFNPLTATDPVTEFQMISVNRYTPQGDTSKLVVLRLVWPDAPVEGPNDYYVGFNEKAGINDGTKEDVNMVVIFQKQEFGPLDYGSSIKKAKLNFGQSYVIENYNNQGKDVKIKFLKLAYGVATINVIDKERAPPEDVKDPNTCPDDQYPLIIEILPDMYPDDTSWSIIDATSKSMIAYGDKYKSVWKPDDEKPEIRLACVPLNRKYQFIIMDQYSDGLCCAAGTGYYKGTGPHGEVLFTGGYLAVPPFQKTFGKTDVRDFTSPTGVVAPTEPPTQPPTTSFPTNPPTNAPIVPPTNPPTNPPTIAPIASPTNPPTNPPTNAPIVPPTNPPTNPPTIAPIASPTNPPTNPPTNAPIVPPTNPPTNAPIVTPMNSPTATPTVLLDQAPTDSPIAVPSPTKSPTTQNQDPCKDDANFAYSGVAKQNCKWVGKKKTKRCKLVTDAGTKVADSCPGKCLKKCKPCKDKKKRFKIDSIIYKCSNFEKNDFSCSTQVDSNKGKGKKIQQLCPKTCNTC